MFEIGQIYRYPRVVKADKKDENSIWRIENQKEIDGLRNFYYETKPESDESVRVVFQRGIHTPAPVKLIDGSERVPFIIISSSPHKSGTDNTPWEDDFDPDYGHILYYGDAKNNDKKAYEFPGNAALLNLFEKYSSYNEEVRIAEAVPLIFFEKVTVDGRKKGNLKFQGFGIIERVKLITQFNPKLTVPYFSNYVYDMCVFSMTKENEQFDWKWINDRRNPNISNIETLKKAPEAWRYWVKHGSSELFKVRRRILSAKVISKTEQMPIAGSKEEYILKTIYDYYADKKHTFELLAMRVTQEIFEESGTKFQPGWITGKSLDRGIDFVARIDMGSQISTVKIVILGQAKCEKLDTPTNGLHIARTVARLKRGWLGVYVTTSYFSENVQLEVMDDQYPVMLISGQKLAETVNKILFKKGIDLNTFLKEIDDEYYTETKRTEEILIS